MQDLDLVPTAPAAGTTMLKDADAVGTRVDIDAETLLTRLFARTGKYAGQGVDGSGRGYRGQLTIEPLVGRGVLARFTACDTETGEAFHEEVMTFARDGLGGLACWVLTNQSTGVERLGLTCTATPPLELASNELALHFAVGDPADTTQYRAALRIVLRARGSLEVVWSCGLPGGDFAERSGLRLRPTA